MPYFKESIGAIGFTCSAFDLFHPGHIQMLREAKGVCNYLMVGLHVDPSVDRDFKNSPVQTVVERYVQLAACEYVDEIIPYETEQDLVDILNLFPIKYRIIGEEYKGKEFTGYEECLQNKIEIYYNKRPHRFSSTNLREQVINSNNLQEAKK